MTAIEPTFRYYELLGIHFDFRLIRKVVHSNGDAFRQDHLANGLKARGDLADGTIEKILSVNPQRLFHF
jgi:hypothetical protein